MSSCFLVFMFSRKSGTLRPTFLRKPEMPRTTWCVPLSFSHFFHVFIFSGVSLRGSHIAEGSTWKFSLFPFYCLFNELNITISVVCISLQRIGLTTRRAQPKQYQVANLACIARVSNRIIARKLERGKGGYNKALLCAGPGSIQKNNSSLEKATTVTYKTFHSLDICISNSVIFSCFVFHGRLTKTFMQTSLDRFW